MRNGKTHSLDSKSLKLSGYLLSAKDKMSLFNENQIIKSKQLQLRKNIKSNFSTNKQSINQPQIKTASFFNRNSVPILQSSYSSGKLDLETQKDKHYKVNRNQSKQRNTQVIQNLFIKWRKSYSGSNNLQKSSILKSKSNSIFLPKDFQNKQKKHESIKLRSSIFNNNKQSNIQQTEQKQIDNQKPQRIPQRQRTSSLVLKKSNNSFLTKKLYSTIRHYDKDQQLWLYHLEQQLSLKQTIQEFQKIELNRNLQPTKKLTMRQAYQLKKQIVLEIQKQEFLSIQSNIQRLTQIALDQKEKDKFLMIGFFMSVRDKLKAHKQFFNSIQKSQINYNTKSPDDHNQISDHPLKDNIKLSFVYKRQIIDMIKEQVKNWKHYKFVQPNIITIKIMSVLTLHLLKLQSPIFSENDIQLISSTIKLKKKGQLIIDYLSEDDKRRHFQALIYIIFQFYKNLYYLKLDQQLKNQQYNLLIAYMSLYQQKNMKNFQIFQEKYRIGYTLQNIKPASFGIYAYQDSKVRNQIKFKTLQKQINNHSSEGQQQKINRKPKIKLNKKTFIQLNEDKANYKKKNTLSEDSDQISQQSQISSQQDSFMYADSNIQLRTIKSNQSITNHFSTTQMIQRDKVIDTNKSIKPSFHNFLSSVVKNTNTRKQLKLQIKTTPKRKTIFDIQAQKQLKQFKQSQKQQKGINCNNYCFQFMFFKGMQTLKGYFVLYLDKKNKTINISTKVKDHKQNYILIYNFKGIKNINEEISSIQFQRLIWKIFKKIFVTNYVKQQNPFLIKEPNANSDYLKGFIQQNLSNDQLHLVEVIHQYLIYWLKAQAFDYKYNGKTIQMPRFNTVQINSYLENMQFQHDKKLFSKRHGYLEVGSARRGALSPQKQHFKLAFNNITNQFVFNDSFQKNKTKNQIFHHSFKKNLLFFVKICAPDKTQLKLVRMLFLQFLREVNIFQIGLFKHTYTSLIEQNIPTLRKIKNGKNMLKDRLILQVQLIFSLINKNFSLFHEYRKITPFLHTDDYVIQQQFQVQLTNQYKFIPSLNILLISKIPLFDQELCFIKQTKLKNNQTKINFNKKIYNNFVKFNFSSKQNMPDVENTQIYMKTHKSPSEKYNSLFKTFKISNQLFPTIQFQFQWGRKFLCLQKNLQFFMIHEHMKQQFVKRFDYHLLRVSLYKMGILINSKLQEYEHQGNIFYFHQVRKPFISKVGQNLSHLKDPSRQSKNKQTNSLKRTNRNSMIKKRTYKQTIIYERITDVHYMSQKIYFKILSHKIFKSKIQQQVCYFSFQTFQLIKKKQEEQIMKEGQLMSEKEQNIIQSNHYLYQLTNLKESCQKYYLFSKTQLTIEDYQNFNSVIDLNEMTLKGQKMQSFQIPIRKVAFRNVFHQKKIKLIRKKVISQANYYFQQKWLQNCDFVKNQEVLIDILLHYKAQEPIQQIQDL